MDVERYYNIVYDQEFSPSGKHLATCDAFGKIALFNLQNALTTSGPKSPLRVIKGQDGPLYGVTNVGPLLASGGCHDIKLWKWEELVSTSTKPQPLHILTPPPVSRKNGTSDTNCIVYDAKSETLYSGGGDNTVQSWDVRTGTIKQVFSGHTGYIHCLCLRGGGGGGGGGGCVLSGAEDGTVRMWDPSSPTAAGIWKPAKSTVGQWVGCVSVDREGEWMVCGGSMPPSIYRLSSSGKIASLDTPNGVVTQTAIFANDRIVTGGSETVVRHWAVNGEQLATVPGGHHHCFSLAYNSHHNKSKQYEVLTACGDSSDIHVFTDFGYRAFSLTVT